MIKAEEISKRFGTTQALDHVDLDVQAGQLLALLGPNGSGKTTLIRTLTTLLTPESGRATVAGFDVLREPVALRSMIGLAGQYATVDELLTGRENLELIGLLYHLRRADYRRRAQDSFELLSLTDAGDQQVKTYSGGMRRRLDLGVSLIGRPPVLFLDEPTTGLDPRTRNDLWRFITDLVQDGTTVLLTTQYMQEAEHLASTLVVIDAGQVVARGTADDLKDHLGGDLLEVRVTNRADLERAAALIGALGTGPPSIDPDLQRVSNPIKGGTKVLIAAGRLLDAGGIALADLGIRRPSLEDVFLSITAHSAQASADGDGDGDGDEKAGGQIRTPASAGRRLP
jgi:ABC-2 type transport system ATP-binding protein